MLTNNFNKAGLYPKRNLNSKNNHNNAKSNSGMTKIDISKNTSDTVSFTGVVRREYTHTRTIPAHTETVLVSYNRWEHIPVPERKEHMYGNIYHPYCWDTSETIEAEKELNFFHQVDGHLGDTLNREGSITAYLEEVRKMQANPEKYDKMAKSTYGLYEHRQQVIKNSQEELKEIRGGLFGGLFSSRAKELEKGIPCDIVNSQKALIYYKNLNKMLNATENDIKKIIDESELIKQAKAKGHHLDMSLENPWHSDTPLYTFLEKIKNNKNDTGWIETKVVSLPKLSKKVSNLIQDAFGHPNYESIKQKENLIKAEMQKSDFVDTVMRHVRKIW